MERSRLRSIVADAWTRLSAAGVDRVDVTRVRMVEGANHLFVLGSLAHLPFVVYLAAGAPPATLLPALAQVGLIAVWCAGLFLNSRGQFLAAAIAGVVAPVVQLGYLTIMMSRDAGFHLQLVMIGGLVYTVFARRHWRVGFGAGLVAATAAGVLHVLPASAAPHFPVSELWVEGAMVMNLALMALFMYATGYFNHRYYTRERRRNERLLAEASRLAATDSLTGLVNRRGIEPALHDAIAEGHYSLAFVDVDRFKDINDRFGHSRGDSVLEAVAERLRASLPAGARLARWGGEEFLVVMPGLSLVAAVVAMERMRVATEGDVGVGGELEHVTVSIGVAHSPTAGRGEEALRLADGQLYAAKESGRNAVRGAALARTALGAPA